MTERERLISIIESARMEAIESARMEAMDTIGSMNKGFAAWYAYKLLEAGVIVPPMRIGQTVYQTDGIRIYENVVSSLSVFDDIVIAYCRGGVVFDESAIGTSIFLTREEAEKKMDDQQKKGV